MTPSDVLIGRATPGSPVADAALACLRVLTGLGIALAHGLGKVPPGDGLVGMISGLGLPAPQVFAWLAAAGEFVGGLLLALGLLTRVGALGVAAVMLGAVVGVHAGDPFSARELALAYLVVALTFLVLGGGRYSVDALLRGDARR